MIEIDGEEYYTTSEAAEYISICKQTIRNLFKKGKIRGHKIGKVEYVYLKNDLSRNELGKAEQKLTSQGINQRLAKRKLRILDFNGVHKKANIQCIVCGEITQNT